MTKILIAEDEQDLRAIYEDCFGLKYPHSVLKLATTGEEAISSLEEMLARGEKPELVITDNNMPPGEKTGMDVIDYVRKNCPEVPVIVIAVDDYEMTVKKIALEKGASACLSKPFKLQELFSTVGKYVIPDK